MSAEKMTPREKLIQNGFDEAGISNRRPVRGVVAKIDGFYYPVAILALSTHDHERVFVKIKTGKSGLRRCPLSWEKEQVAERRTGGWISSLLIFVDGKKYAERQPDGSIKILRAPWPRSEYAN